MELSECVRWWAMWLFSENSGCFAISQLRGSLFHSGQVFYELVCPLIDCCFSSDFLQSHYTVLLYSVLLPFFHAPINVVVHFPVFLRSFRFKSFLSQFSPSVTQIKNLCSDPGFSSGDVCQGSHWLFQLLLFWRWWSLNPGLYLHCSWRWEVQTSHVS